MSQKGEALAEHYQKTYELTYLLWQQRNRTFLMLLAMVGVSTLLTFRVPQADSLLVDFVASLVGVTENAARMDELRRGFPVGLLQTILLMVIFYLMVNLHHRAAYILRNYRYLAALESEIRTELGLGKESVAFTREGTFYWNKPAPLSGYVKWVYIALLGALLLAFMFGRIIEDIREGTKILVAADLAIALPTLLFFFGYARSSATFDTRTAIIGPAKPVDPKKTA